MKSTLSVGNIKDRVENVSQLQLRYE